MSWESVLGIAGIVIGIISSLYFYRRSIPVRQPRWAVKSNTLVQDNISKLSGLKILYKKHPITTLTISKILFWNAGNTTINRIDIAKANPLRIEAKGDVKLLDINVLMVNNQSNRLLVSINQDKKSAPITFDYLDSGNGSILQITHTGKSSDDITVFGDIKGGKSPKLVSNLLMLDLSIDISTIATFLITSFAFAIIMVVINQIWDLQIYESGSPYPIIFVLIIPLLASFIYSGFVIPILRRRLRGFPDGLGNLKEFLD